MGGAGESQSLKNATKYRRFNNFSLLQLWKNMHICLHVLTKYVVSSKSLSQVTVLRGVLEGHVAKVRSIAIVELCENDRDHTITKHMWGPKCKD